MEAKTTEEKRTEAITEMVEKMKQMDVNSLAIMQSATTVLIAKERLDRETRIA